MARSAPITLRDLETLQDAIATAEGWHTADYHHWLHEYVPDEDGEIARERQMDEWASRQTEIDAIHGM